MFNVWRPSHAASRKFQIPTTRFQADADDTALTRPIGHPLPHSGEGPFVSAQYNAKTLTLRLR